MHECFSELRKSKRCQARHSIDQEFPKSIIQIPLKLHDLRMGDACIEAAMSMNSVMA